MDIGSGNKDAGIYGERRVQREKIRSRAGRKALTFEKRLEEEKGGSELGRKCKEEMRRNYKEGKELSEREEERKRFFEERRISSEEIEEKRREEGDWFGEIEKKDKEK
jgi:hypothetical protein